MPKGYLISDIDVTDQTRYADYRKLSGPAVAKYGGRFLVRGGETRVLEGDWRPNRVVVVEFDSVEDAQRCYDSPEYGEAKAIRQEAARSSFILVAGA